MNWDEYFLGLLPVIAAKSKDRETKVGCIIVNSDNSIVSTGYNSLVRGLDDTKVHRLNRPDKYTWIEHADRNAIYNAARIGVSTKGCKTYLPFYPCVDCARGIVSAGINEVVVGSSTFSARLRDMQEAGRTYETIRDNQIVEEMFDECGVKLRFA